jgi:heavy metal translocating P-type ATPase
MPSMIRETVHVRGMRCASCAGGLERTIAALPGVRRAAVSFATERATIEVASEDVRAVVEAHVRGRGYEVVADASAPTGEDDTGLHVRLAITVFFAMAAMMPSAVVLLGVEAAGSPAAARALAFASGVLALPAVVVGGWPVFQGALRALRTPGMDLLVAMGTAVTFGFSLVALARGGHAVYFDTAAMIVAFALTGRTLEARARRRGVGALRALDALVPGRAHQVGPSGDRDVPVVGLQVSDLVRVRAGERVPIDGLVREGSSLADAAVLTGEWAPRSIGPGDRIAAGLLLLDGTLVVEVERGVGHREVDLIRRAVDGLLSSRAPMQRLADALALRLAWIVLALATVTLVGTGLRLGFGAEAWMRAVAVVVVACPCALGLAAPMAITVAARRAAARGILFRDAEAIELAAGIDRVLLDKTGTLTEGRPRVTSVSTTLDERDLLGVASLLERGVDHPIARALREAAPPADAKLAIEVVPGGGVIGRGATTWMLGSARFLRAQGVEVSREPGEMAVHVARDGAWVGSIALEDAVRPAAGAAVRGMIEDGLEPELVTGDAASAARRVARVVGIARVHAERSPLDKAGIVRAAREGGRRVAFVGDGLNDGPALAAADLGIAVAGATDLATESARVVLLQGGVERVREALEIARATHRRMRRNLAWAVLYNVLAIPVAALGWLSPALAAAAMAASSLSVVLSAMGLERPAEARAIALEEVPA